MVKSFPFVPSTRWQGQVSQESLERNNVYFVEFVNVSVFLDFLQSAKTGYTQAVFFSFRVE